MDSAIKLLEEARGYLYHHEDCPAAISADGDCGCGVRKVRIRIDALLKTGGWVPVTERLPDAGKPVLAAYKNSLGNWRRVRAIYAPKFSLLESEFGDFEEGADYEEDEDTLYWPEGWYEYPDQDGMMAMAISDPVILWQDLPPLPEEKS